jgi:hypothetical protein
MPQPAEHLAELAACGLRLHSRLGSGQEADVYRAADAGGQQWVVKLFDPVSRRVLNDGGRVGRGRRPIGPAAVHLRRLSAALQQPTAGLTPFELLDVDRQVIGLRYRFEPLAQLRRVLLCSAAVRRAYLAAFAAAQAWLLRNAGVAGTEPQFMIAHDGSLRFIEYGPMVLSLDDVRIREERYLSQTLFRLISALYLPDAPAAPWHQLRGRLRRDNPLAAALIDRIADGDELLFADAGWYGALAASGSARIPLPLVWAARALHRPRDTRKPPR